MQELDYWIWFSTLSILPRKKYQLIEEFHSPKKIYELTEYKPYLSHEDWCIIQKKDLKSIIKIKEYTNKHAVSIISFNDDRYPQKLKTIYDPPMVLYAKGNIDLLNQKGIAIVGSRNSNEYGNQIAYRFARELCGNQFAIISGLAKGIDKMAHLGALSCKGNTIAVLGNGIDVVYPNENSTMYTNIFEKGLIITEFPVGTRPEGINFPMRNRLISGLSEGVLVVQAKEKSGSLISADFALEQGREVYAIPGNIDEPLSVGTNMLIQDGAKIVTKVEDIVNSY